MWEPRAIIVMFIAAAVSLATLAGIVAVSLRGTRLSDVGGDVLIAILGAMVAIIAGYVGRHATADKPKDDTDKDGET